ncbi:TetR/AcrR family transcriptional regulator [Agromyces sp. CF514]|uniref:TetR/AcrR family transcriptional regulator n=1 Tax=Agromyces sp. CF514 TaxID=1881031 RepID=UPI0015A70BEB|nr:TetR/AcrR family transcriptional regulator [Agromyces sp. CF514]
MSTIATKRGPYARTQQRREQIARAVLDIVEELGHEAVTIALVAERSDTSEATVLYHFPSRDHLLVAALAYSDRMSDEKTHASESDEPFSLEEFHASIEAGGYDGNLVRLLLVMKGQTATADHPAAAYFAGRYETQIGIFTRLIAGRQRDGYALAALDARQIAVQLVAVWDGLTNLWLTDPGFSIADLVIDAYRRLAGENIVEARALINRTDFGL